MAEPALLLKNKGPNRYYMMQTYPWQRHLRGRLQGLRYLGIFMHTRQIVAIKKIWDGHPKEEVMREIQILEELKDPNVIELIDSFHYKGDWHLVFEFMHTDLETIIRDTNTVLSPADIKSFMLMTLKGLAFCHKKSVLHRDLKPDNILIRADGQLKVADFGLSCIFGGPDSKFTSQVCTKSYRAPELLLGSKQYGSGVDVWAAACIFAALLLRRTFLEGSSEIDQLKKIFQAFGTPTPEQWPGMVSLPDYMQFQYVPAPPLRSLLPMASDDALDLLAKMFTYNPSARISVQQALEHRYFSSAPPPTESAKLPRPSRKEYSGAARGSEWKDIGAYDNLGALDLAGLTVAIVLGFVVLVIGEGFRIGTAVGSAVQITLLSLITAFTNWQKQESKTRERII